RRIVGDNNLLGKPRVPRRALKGFGGGVQIAGAVIDDRRRHRGLSASGNRPITSELFSFGMRTPLVRGLLASARVIFWLLSIHSEKKRRSAASRSSPTTTPTFFQPRKPSVQRRSVPASSPTRMAMASSTNARRPVDAPTS